MRNGINAVVGKKGDNSSFDFHNLLASVRSLSCTKSQVGGECGERTCLGSKTGARVGRIFLVECVERSQLELPPPSLN